jgi:hypothetical protein
LDPADGVGVQLAPTGATKVGSRQENFSTGFRTFNVLKADRTSTIELAPLCTLYNTSYFFLSQELT